MKLRSLHGGCCSRSTPSQSQLVLNTTTWKSPASTTSITCFLVERAGSGESRQIAYSPTWLQGRDCCYRVSQQPSSKMPNRKETWCKKFADLQAKCSFATMQFNYLVCVYVYILRNVHKTSIHIHTLGESQTLLDRRNHCLTMKKNRTCSNKCFSPFRLKSRDNFVTSNYISFWRERISCTDYVCICNIT